MINNTGKVFRSFSGAMLMTGYIAMFQYRVPDVGIEF